MVDFLTAVQHAASQHPCESCAGKLAFEASDACVLKAGVLLCKSCASIHFYYKDESGEWTIGQANALGTEALTRSYVWWYVQLRMRQIRMAPWELGGAVCNVN